jgi:chitosanase
MMKLTDQQRRICERVINVFETGTVAGKYGAISIYRDGPNKIRQVTYGRSQTTEYGNLRQLVEMYVAAQGKYSAELAPYVPKIGQVALVDDATFKDLLTIAGDEDPVMRSTQDAFFDKAYFTPALKWADTNGFTHALSMLVIYDSFIHSGRILDLLRSRFPEVPPAKGGDEKKWILQYVTARDKWLANHDNPEVRPSAYRTRDMLREIGLGNWDLSILPINANGTPVDDAGAAGAPVTIKIPKPAEPVIEFHGEAELPTDPNPDPVPSTATETAAALASRILASDRIKLATVHPSGVIDQANARQNIVDTAAGKPASRSNYDNAPGGTVALDTRLLSALLELAED